MVNTFINYWKHALDFKGISTKKEFLVIILFNAIVAVILSIVGGVLSELLASPLWLELPNVYFIISKLPTIAMGVRILNGIKKK